MTQLLDVQLPARHALGNGAPGRWLHPGAWWLWALAMATAASQTSNPLVLLGLVAVAATVVTARRPAAPWARSFRVFLLLGMIVIAIRVLTQMVFGAPTGGTVLYSLPEIGLPDFLAGVRLGGAVTTSTLLIGFYEGLRLATLLACLGAASSLASPSRMLKSVPAALYEVGVAIVVTLTLVPQLLTDLTRVRRAQRLRGRPTTGLHGWWSSAFPVINGSLERSVALAAAMDSRGYGRTANVPRSIRMMSQSFLLIGLMGVLVGIYGLLSGGAISSLGPWFAGAGIAVAVLGLWLAGRRGLRTHYRPDPWAAPEWIVAASGVAVAAIFIVVGGQPGTALVTSVSPPEWPQLTPPIVLALIVGLLPAVVAPPVPLAVRR